MVRKSSSRGAVTGQDSDFIQILGGDVETKAKGLSDPSEDISDEPLRVKERVIPPPGTGQRIYEIDPLLSKYSEHLNYR